MGICTVRHQIGTDPNEWLIGDMDVKTALHHFNVGDTRTDGLGWFTMDNAYAGMYGADLFLVEDGCTELSSCLTECATGAG